jgi:peroxiredoxin
MLKKIIPVSGLCLIAALLFASFYLSARVPATTNPIDFTLRDFNDKSYTLSDVKDSKAVVVMFWSAECPNVQAYNGRIVKIVENYSPNSITFWAINSNMTENATQIKSHAQENSYNFPVLIDPNSSVADKFSATRTPEVFVLDKDRNVVYHGRIDNSKDESKVSSHDLTNALDEILAGKDVTVKETKSFGCTIKRKSD